MNSIVEDARKRLAIISKQGDRGLMALDQYAAALVDVANKLQIAVEALEMVMQHGRIDNSETRRDGGEVMDIDELRKLAEAATPGPWRAWFSNTLFHVQTYDQEKSPLQAYVAKGSWWGENSITRPGERQAKANAIFIAAASPATVLALLDRIAELEDSNRACVETVAEWGAKAGALQAEVDRLRDLFKVENGVHRQHIKTLNKQLDKERDLIVGFAAGFKAERDQWKQAAEQTMLDYQEMYRDYLDARDAVRRLVGAIDGIFGGQGDCDVAAMEALADPVVRRIVAFD